MRTFLSFLSLLFVVSAFSQAPPTNPTTAVTFFSIQGDRASLSISRGNGSYRIVVIKKDSPVTFAPTDGSSYLSNATFGSGQQVALGEYIIMSSASNSVTPTNLIPASTYHIAVFEFNGTGNASSYLVSPNFVSSFTTLSAPTAQATGLAVSNVNSNTLTLSWTPGTGDYSMILAKEGSPVNANPVDLSSYYANNTYYQVSNGPAQIGVGNFVLYKGTGNTVNIDNLNPNTTYHFAVFTFNGSSAPVYLTTNPSTAFATTLQYPTIQVSNLLFDTVEGDRFRATWTAGNGAGRIAIIREGQPITLFPQDGTAYTGNPNFVNATDIGGGHKIIYSGVGNNVSINNLISGTNYHIAVFEYAGSGAARTYNIVDYQTAIQAPVIAPIQNVVSVTASLITHNQARLTTQPGNGSGRFIVVRANNPTTYEPVDLNGYNYSSTPNLNDSSGSVGDGNEVVFLGTGNVVNLTNALPNTTYYVSAYELNGNNYPIFNTTSPALTTFTTLLPPAPTTPSTNLNFTAEGNSLRLQWSNGNGARRIVLMSTAPITAIPQNGVQYTPNSDFTLAPEIAAGEKIVFDGTTYVSTVTELEIGTTYYVKIYEYNGTDLLTNYLINPNLSGSYSTVAAPTVSSSNMYVQQVSQDELLVYWTNGNGSRKLMIGRLNEAVDAVPEDLTSYNASSYFNSGSEVAPGQKTKYYYTGAGLGQESYTTIYSVSPGNTYHFKLFEANGNIAPVYNTVDPASVSYTIGYEPINPSTNMGTQSYDGGSMTAYIGDTGGGTKRIIVAREGSPVSFIPQDGIDYAANANFSLGLDLGDGQKVVYDNASYFVNVTGLEHSKTYHYAVFEYGGTGANIDYLTSAFATASGSTLSLPTQQATLISFNNITSLSSNISWTNGNGTKRLVIAKRDAAVDVEPQDYTNYNSYSSSFGSSGGLGNGNYVVYKNNSNNFNLSNLLSGTTYHVSVFEYNGATTPVFKRPALAGFFTTLGPPQDQAQLQPFTNITLNSGQINCLPGSGQKRLIVMKAGSPITVLPNENTAYTPNTFLGSGSSLGDDTFAVYNGFDNQVTVTGLAQGVTYYVAVFEYNSFTGGIVNYLTPSTALDNFTSISDPCATIVCPPGQECFEGGCFTAFYQVSGIVRDATTLLPLENVTIASGLETVFTNAQGYYLISAEGALPLTLTLAGYEILTTDPITNNSSSFDLFMSDLCANIICPIGESCFDGNCFAVDPCFAVVCASGQICVDGDCVDPCSIIVCPPGTFCDQGGCFDIVYQISGFVRDATTLLPLENVSITSNYETISTDSQGYYAIEALWESTLTLSFAGYQTLISDPITSNSTSFDLLMVSSCVEVLWYQDLDADTYGNPANSQTSCTQPTGYVLNNLDCNDAVFAINPDATEICWNNIDDNCNDTKSEGCAAIPVFVNNPVTITNFSTHLSAVPYTYPGATSLDYRYEVTNISVTPNQTRTFTQTGTFARYFTIPVDIRGFNTTYTIRASAVINGEEVPYAVPVITVISTGIPTVKLSSTSCNASLSRLNATISANPGFNASSYEFRIRLTSDNGATPTYYYFQSPSRFIGANSFIGLSLQYNTSYSVSVRYATQSIGDASIPVISAYGDECTITMPSIPLIGLNAPLCGSTLTRLGATISATPATYALQYQFRVRLTSDNGPTPTYYTTIPSASRYSSLMAVQGLVLANNTQYSVSVRYSIPVAGGGTEFSAYGSECILVTPGAAPILRIEEASFKVVAYPNPFTDGFQLNVETENTGIVSIKSYDMIGRLIEERSSKVNTLESLTIGSNYPSGVYNVIVSQEDEVRSVRVIKR